jgi:hypothetical protein
MNKKRLNRCVPGDLIFCNYTKMTWLILSIEKIDLRGKQKHAYFLEVQANKQIDTFSCNIFEDENYFTCIDHT